MVTSEQLQAICKTGAGKRECLKYVEALNKFMPMYGIDTPKREAAFLAQIAHESADFTRVSENLNYSATGLAATWPKRYRQADGTPNALAKSLQRNPEAIANNVYANRMGNGNEASGDGWRHRGGGLKQLTGKDNHRACGNAIGVDLIAHPELLARPDVAVESACWFWKENKLGVLADSGDFEELTERVNGGLNGLRERVDYHARAQLEYGIATA